MANRHGRLAHLAALRESPGYPLAPVATGDLAWETIRQCKAAAGKPKFPIWILEILACVYYAIARQNKTVAEATFKSGDAIVCALWEMRPGTVSAHLVRAVGNYSRSRVVHHDDARRKSLLELADRDANACLEIDPDNPALWALRIEIDTALMRLPGEADARMRAERITRLCVRLEQRGPLELDAMWSFMRAQQELWGGGTSKEEIGSLAAAIMLSEALLVRDPDPGTLHGELALMLREMLHTRPCADDKYWQILRRLVDVVGDCPSGDDLALEVLDEVEQDHLRPNLEGLVEPSAKRLLDGVFARIALVRCKALRRRGQDVSEKLRCALTIYERLVGASPEVVLIHEDLAALYCGLGDQDAVEREVEIIRRLQPDRVPVVRQELKAWARGA
ncbi:MAG: hypothetical protein HUU15_12365 [Candidatus Brocadiae bacterium]|nr:hypothetical protein [Candidatus Brocadiia bacterium]